MVQKESTLFKEYSEMNMPMGVCRFRGSEFHTRNARFRQPQEQRWAKAGFSPYIRPGAFQKRGHFFSPAHTSPGQRPGKL